MLNDKMKELLFETSDCYMVAECGLGWENVEGAKVLVGMMKDAGADAVKFQLFDEEYCDYHPMGELLKQYILSLDDLKVLKREASLKEIDFFVTPYGVKQVRQLEELGVPRYKVRHRDAQNIALLKEIQNTGKDVWISVADNRVDWDFVRNYDKVKLLYTTGQYPTPDDKLYLRTKFEQAYIPSIKYHGYSDHTEGYVACLVAASRGIKIIEKHVMLADNPTFLDYHVSLTPAKFAEMVGNIRRIEKML